MQIDFWGLSEQDHADAEAEDAMRFGVAEQAEQAAPAPSLLPDVPTRIPDHLITRYYGTRAAYVLAIKAQIALDEERAGDRNAPLAWRAGRRRNADNLKAQLAINAT